MKELNVENASELVRSWRTAGKDCLRLQVNDEGWGWMYDVYMECARELEDLYRPADEPPYDSEEDLHP